MQEHTENQVAQELFGSERLLWSGRPGQGILLRPSDAFMIPFSLLWAGFAVFWEASVILGRAGPFFVLWGVPFVLVGVYITVGRFLVDARVRSRTYYGLTSERVVIISGLVRRQVKSLQLLTLSDVTLREGSRGRGTITLGPQPFWASWYAGMNLAGMRSYLAPALEQIDDVRTVYELLRKAQASAG